LSDDADWAAEVWSMRPEVLEPLAHSIHVLLNEEFDNVSLQALWVGDRPNETKHLSIAELVALARSSRLGTKTRYVVDRAG
jgi:hypothetical protein